MANDPKCKTPESIPHGGLRRPFAVIIAAALALGILWITWSTMASRRLQARVDAIRARHEPLYSEDFATEPVAKDQNAALCYQAAATALSPSVFPPSSSTLIRDCLGLAVGPAEEASAPGGPALDPGDRRAWADDAPADQYIGPGTIK
jgi:hypothetical protein